MNTIMDSNNITPTNEKIIIKKKKVMKTIYKSFRLIDFHIYDDQSNENNFTIQMFGINETGETCCIYINDYEPFFYIKVGDNWNHLNVSNLFNFIKKKFPQNEASILKAELVEKHKLYGFTAGKQYKFAKFTFKNVATMNKVKNLWYEYNEKKERKSKPFIYPTLNNGIQLELYESNIPPILRYFHINNISPSGWISVPILNINKSIETELKTTTCTFEFYCNSYQIKPLNDKETRVPYKICSFDIEASSSHGDFPLPKKTYKKLATNMVDCFQKQFSGLKQEELPSAMEKINIYIRNIILSAFEFYKRMDDIELVYPKEKPLKPTIMNNIQTFLNTPIKVISDECNNTEINSILTINEIFEQIQQHNKFEGGGANDDNENSDDENEITEVSNKKPTFKKKPLSTIKQNVKIVDILFDETKTRDEKIQTTNEIMTKLFPRLEGDKVTFIGSTFMKYGDIEPYLNHCLVVGSCDPVDNAIIQTVDTEKDLLLEWSELIQNENPDIIIGYNIFGFDYEFMFRRSEENHCEKDFLKLSRNHNEICGNLNFKTNEISIENTKIQLASGEYDLRYFKMNGRIQIDMYAYFRRDFNLSSYKLDDVAGQYISDNITKISNTIHPMYGEVTELYSQNLTGLHVNDFIHIEITGFTTDYYKDGKKFKILDIIKNDNDNNNNEYKLVISKIETDILEKTKNIKWCIAKDDVTPQDIFRLSNGSSSDRAIVAKYCIQDCNLVHHLMNKIDVITGYVEMSKICSVPISFLVFRGQGIKLTSYVAKKCSEKNTLMPDLDRSGDNDGYEGAIVLPPKCSMYMDNPVACVDYSSLYPSSMISENLCPNSKVWTKEYDLNGNLIAEVGEKDENQNFIYDNLPDFQYINKEFDLFKYKRNPNKPSSRAEKTKVGRKICRWAQYPDGKKAIMPSILEELLKARSDTRKMAKTEKDLFMQNILDKRQLGYKVTANSLYGQCGSKTSTFYEKDVAASTTATGRMMIIYAKNMIEEVYNGFIYNTISHGPVLTNAEYVYGDTDSVFFTFNLQNPETKEKIRGKEALEITIEIAQDAAKLCSQWLKSPMELSYEKTLMPFILLSKKRYVGMLYETDPNKGKMKYMGLSLKRRDSCDYLKDVYGGILTILMKEHNIEKSIEFLNQSLIQLIEGNVNMDKLTITKSLKSDYKNPQQIAHKVLADRIAQRDPGNKPKPGDRMKFIHIVNDTKKVLQGEKIETPDYIIKNKLPIDYSFYITNQLLKPLQQLFGLALEQIWELYDKKSAIIKFRKEMNDLLKDCNNDLEIFMKKKEKYCSLKVKTLLFEKSLLRIQNEKNKTKDLFSYFPVSNNKK